MHILTKAVQSGAAFLKAWCITTHHSTYLSPVISIGLITDSIFSELLLTDLGLKYPQQEI